MASNRNSSHYLGERRVIQQEALMEQIRALRSIPGSEHDRTTNDPTRKVSTENSTRLSFGSLSACQINPDTESALFDLEAGRLLDSLDAQSLPLEAVISLSAPEPATHHNSAHLEPVIKALMCSLAITGLDDVAVLYTCEPQARVDRGVMLCAGQKLDDFQIPIEALGHTTASLTHALYSTRWKKTALETVNSISDHEAPGYYALVDYMTATVARMLASEFEDDSTHEKMTSWQPITLAVIAKMSAKMKVLGHRLSDFRYDDKHRPQTYDRHRSHARAPRAASLSSESPLIPRTFERRSSDLPEDDVFGGQRSHQNNYVSDMSEISALVFHIMWRILSDLGTRDISDRNSFDLDISAIVYATGTQQTLAVLYHDARSGLTGSQTGVALGMCRRILNILVETTNYIQQKHDAEDCEPLRLLPRPTWPQLTITMNTDSAPASPIAKGLRVKSIPDLVRIMVPLSCMSPSVADKVFRACSKVGAPHAIRRLHAGGRNFTATVSLSSAVEIHSIESAAYGTQSTSLSQAHFFLRQSAGTTGNTMAQAQPPRRMSNTQSGRVPCRQLSGSHCCQSFDVTREWAIEDTAVTVRCLNYTLPIMAGCGILVTGGLLAGFLVGERIAGVDPFNLTMFCWIIAGFVIVVAKSIRVVSWPWRDFLLGQVTTRSVSELASVTGLDGQSIILHLLLLEGRLPLYTRGPFNSVFTWKAGVDAGFSIDVQPTVRTLSTSGMVVLEVLSSDGPALVCMDLRPEMNRFNPAYLRKVVHTQNERVEVLACVRPPREDEAGKDISFRDQKIRWERVIGIYNDEDRQVR